jgi:hypothetical protein
MQSVIYFDKNISSWVYFEIAPDGERLGSPGYGQEPEDAISLYEKNLPEKEALQRKLFLDFCFVSH